MSATNAWYIFKDINSAKETTTWNTQGETLNLQVLGDASSLNLQVLGQVDGQSNTWVVLNAVNVTTLDMATSITKKGIYMISVDGLAQIKFKLTSVSGGNITVFGRITRG